MRLCSLAAVAGLKSDLGEDVFEEVKPLVGDSLQHWADDWIVCRGDQADVRLAAASSSS